MQNHYGQNIYNSYSNTNFQDPYFFKTSAFGGMPGFTPTASLQWAIANGNTEDVRRLVQEGANLNLTTVEGLTPLGIVDSQFFRPRADMHRLLIELGAN